LVGFPAIACKAARSDAADGTGVAKEMDRRAARVKRDCLKNIIFEGIDWFFSEWMMC
jgi:hypothetical protein